MGLWPSILDIARYTPSPHNTQPWKLQVLSNTEADLHIDRGRTLPDEDITGCFIVCAMGMFVETVVIVGANLGHRIEFDATDSPPPKHGVPAQSCFGRFRIVGAAMPDACSNELILKRKTSRLPPLSRTIDPGDISELAGLASAGGQRFTHVKDNSLIRAILSKNVDAVFHDLNVRAYREEIASWFRYGVRHGARTLDGLESRCMNMTALELYCTAHAPRLLLNPATRGLMRAVYNYRLGPAIGLGMLSGAFWGRAEAERAGRCLMRLWLEMARRDIGIHPFGNLVTNSGAHRWLTDATGVKDIWLVFRMGHTEAPPRSHRLPTEDLLIHE